jgi:hypothetical protein
MENETESDLPVPSKQRTRVRRVLFGGIVLVSSKLSDSNSAPAAGEVVFANPGYSSASWTVLMSLGLIFSLGFSAVKALSASELVLGEDIVRYQSESSDAENDSRGQLEAELRIYIYIYYMQRPE